MRKSSQVTRIALASLAIVVIVGVTVWLNLPLRLPRASSPLQASSPNKAQPGGSPPSAAQVAPDVNPAAFKGQGDLAFVSQGLLYNLAGATGQVKQLSEFGQASFPAWSPDGQWVAYILNNNSQSGSGPLWLVRRDGTQLHQVQGLPGPVRGFSWSPTTDELAVGQDNGLWLVPTQGRPDQVVATKTAPGFLWSPDGKSIAYSITLPWTDPVKRSDALYTVAVNGGKPVQRLITEFGRESPRVYSWDESPRIFRFLTHAACYGKMYLWSKCTDINIRPYRWSTTTLSGVHAIVERFSGVKLNND